MREKILNELNKILVTENAKEISESNLLTDSELDSFGYAMLFIELNENYNCFDKEYLNSINYKSYTAKDLIDRIIQCS